MAFRMAPLKLSAAAGSPHLRLMATGARNFHVGRVAAIESSRPSRAVAASKQGPYVQGTVNDPTPFPEPDAKHGSYHWAFERLVSVALVPLIAAGAVKHGSSGLLDGALALTLIVHSHIGFDSILADYLHKRKFPIMGPTASWTLKAATLGALVGLYEFNTNDVGLTELVAKLWVA